MSLPFKKALSAENIQNADIFSHELLDTFGARIMVKIITSDNIIEEQLAVKLSVWAFQYLASLQFR